MQQSPKLTGVCHTVFVNVKKLRFVDFEVVKSTKNSQIYLKHLSNELYASSIFNFKFQSTAM